MKKNYFKPEAELVDVRIDNYILNDSTDMTDLGGGGEALSNKHRGEWGNVWGK